MKVKELYNQLGRFESRISGKNSYPIHKKLIFNNEQFNDLNDWLINNIDIKKSSTVLDAGCGTGKTLFMLRDKFSIEGLGISLSKVEIDLAKAHKRQNNYDKINFKVASFDDDLPLNFDLIIAIESIKHSIDYRKSIQNLADHLNPGGELWLIEDIRKSEIKKLLKTEQFMSWWHVPFLFDQSEIEAACNNENLKVKALFNLTSNMSQKSLLKAQSRYRLWRFLLRLIPFKNVRNNVKTFLGGFILDQWYLKKQMAYLVFKFEKS